MLGVALWERVGFGAEKLSEVTGITGGKLDDLTCKGAQVLFPGPVMRPAACTRSVSARIDKGKEGTNHAAVVKGESSWKTVLGFRSIANPDWSSRV